MKAIHSLITLLSLILLPGCLRVAPPLEWTMINACHHAQGDAHLLIIPQGPKMLIDVGNNTDEVGVYLKNRGIQHIDTVYVTHPHQDHYGGLEYLVKNGFSLGEVFFHTPDKAMCDKEAGWGCNYTHVLATQELLRKNNIPIRTAKTGDILFQNSTTRLDLIVAHDGKSEPIGSSGINDLSLIMMLTHGQIRTLFTGDLNNGSLVQWLSKNPKSLKADLLKVPHHGTESLAPNSFFEIVNPEKAFVPAYESLWLSDRSLRPRTYFGSKEIPTYINGIHGNVTVYMGEKNYWVLPEKAGRSLL